MRRSFKYLVAVIIAIIITPGGIYYCRMNAEGVVESSPVVVGR